jgi:hypothetical protein
LLKETEDYLARRGLKNAIYTIDASDLNDDLFGNLVPCAFQVILLCFVSWKLFGHLMKTICFSVPQLIDDTLMLEPEKRFWYYILKASTVHKN